jgi:hypothetical protein
MRVGARQADPRRDSVHARCARGHRAGCAASRLYLRQTAYGHHPAKVRLVGKDTGAPGERTAREALPTRSSARERRLLAAAALAANNATAARDSLAVLRLESIADAPAFAEALSSLLEALSRGEGADVTEPFLRARRVLAASTAFPRRGRAVAHREPESSVRAFARTLVFATAQYDSGDWDSAPMVPANVIDAIARYTSAGRTAGVVVPLGSEACFQYPSCS